MFLKKTGDAALIEEHAWERIECGFYSHLDRVVFSERELASLLESFNKVNIDILLLKGAALWQTVYRENPVRSLSDFDFLVRHEDLARAMSLLSDLGYADTKSPSLPSMWHQENLSQRLHKWNFDLVNPSKMVMVDLHVEPLEAGTTFTLPAELMWKEAILVNIGTSRAFLPSPRHLFAHLAFHLIKHRSISRNVAFSWYLDLAECLRYFGDSVSEAFPPDVISKDSKGKRMSGEISSLLTFLENELHSVLPAGLRKFKEEHSGCADGIDVSRVFSIQKHGFKAELMSFKNDAWLDRPGRIVELFFSTHGFRKKLVFIWKGIFPDNDYIIRKYGSSAGVSRASAYFKHFFAVFWKAANVVCYWIKKKISTAS